jgi:hypothetical protein
MLMRGEFHCLTCDTAVDGAGRSKSLRSPSLGLMLSRCSMDREELLMLSAGVGCCTVDLGGATLSSSTTQVAEPEALGFSAYRYDMVRRTSD